MFLSPENVLAHLPLTSTMRVADFGAGTGVYTKMISQKMQGEGVVYAFEVFEPHVEALHGACEREGMANVFPLCVDLNLGIPLKDNLLNVSLLINTLYALKAREQFLKELNRVMQRGGSVLVVDWASSFKNIGPQNESVITPGDAVRLFSAHGFSVGDMLPAGTHHYAFIAKRQ